MKLDRLLSAKDIAERYGKSEKTAMRYMRQMEHMEKPLRVTESAVAAWEISKTYIPQEKIKPIRRMEKKYTIPRIRPKTGGAA
jgi:predicted DNA-binding transcriptional regulator YafY